MLCTILWYKKKITVTACKELFTMYVKTKISCWQTLLCSKHYQILWTFVCIVQMLQYTENPSLFCYQNYYIHVYSLYYRCPTVFDHLNNIQIMIIYYLYIYTIFSFCLINFQIIDIFTLFSFCIIIQTPTCHWWTVLDYAFQNWFVV